MAGVRRQWRILVAAAALAALPAHALELFIAPAGADTNSGLAADQPLKSFARALEIARGKVSAAAPETVTVRFAAGDYGAGSIKADWQPGDKSELVIEGKSAQGRARFDGGSGSGTWMVIDGQEAKATRVVVRGFEVRNYRMAIAFPGDRRAEPSSSSYNRIEDNLFENIGQFRENVKPAFAAITLINSRRNEIARNTFRNIRNLQQCGGLHAIYLASQSSRNRIIDNVFDGGCGDTIKVRDRSNENEIRGNTFRDQTGKALLVDSFCDRRKVEECNDAWQECPSWDNVFVGNKIDPATQRGMKSPVRVVGSGRVSECPPPPGGRDRIVTRL